MKNDTVILLVEDDFGHANLIMMYLEQLGIANQAIDFYDGQKVLDFLFRNGSKLQQKITLLIFYSLI